jgi:hypothetical protein
MVLGAEQNAKSMGATGYKYPYRSAYTGVEVGLVTSGIFFSPEVSLFYQV